jgi:hypothetical protein
MTTTIRIHVYQGDRVELLPAMCLFCGHPLGEEQFQHVDARIGQAAHRLALPICLVDKLPDPALTPDSGAAPVAGANPPRYQPYLTAAFTFAGANSRFAQELERLRNLPTDQYDAQMAQSNEILQSLLQGKPTDDAIQAEEHRRETEAQEAEDEATFGLAGAARTGDVSRAETRASSRKLLWISLIAGALGVLLVMCIGVSILAYTVFSRTPEPTPEELAKKKAIAAPKEMKAKIKLIDRERDSLTVLGADSKRYSLKVANTTDFFDREGNLLPLGINDPRVREEEFCTILQTADRLGLQWLKLTPPPN